MTNPLEDPSWVRYLGNEIHEYVTREADKRDEATEQRHKELLAAIEASSRATIRTIEAGFRLLADALRSR